MVVSDQRGEHARCLTNRIVITRLNASESISSPHVQPDEQRDEDQARIAELEQLLGRATRQIEILKKASTLLDAASTRNGR